MAGFCKILARPRPAVTIWLVVLVLTCEIGCVERRMTIRSNPPGATVFVDQVQIGTTPVSHEFVYYGSREIRLVKDGYETLTVLQPTARPWYQFPGIPEFVSENLVPHEIRDEQVFAYQMTPQRVVPTEQLLSRAENLRLGSVQPIAAVLPSGVPTPAIPPLSNPPVSNPLTPGITDPASPLLTPPGRPRRPWPTP